MGLTVDVLGRTPAGAPTTYTLVEAFGRPVVGPVEPTQLRPALIIARERPTGPPGMLRAYPAHDANAITPQEGGEPVWRPVQLPGVGPMFNGAFVWSGDSRYSRLIAEEIGLSDGVPVKLFDRWETPEQYRALSI